MKNKLLNLLLPIYIIINLLYILVGSILFTHRIINVVDFSYGYIILLSLNIIIILYLLLTKKYKENKIDILLLLIFLLAIISTIFAYDPIMSMFGHVSRYEGLFSISYYLSILFLTSFLKKEHKKIIVYSIIILGLIECFYGIFQHDNIFGVNIMYHKGNRVVTGFTTNSNFFGTLMVLSISYCLGLFIDSKSLYKIFINFILICIFLIGLLFSNTLSAVVGLFSVLIVVLIYSIKNKLIIKFTILFIAMISILVMLHKSNSITLMNDVFLTNIETTNIVTGDLSNKYGNGRMKVWKESIKLIPTHALNGVGIDNFVYVSHGKPIIDGKFTFDKAHNEYLQILLTMGIFSLISYLCLHFIILKNGIKNAFKNKKVYLLLPIIGYIVQAQFNISVIEVAPIFYIGLGLLVDRK